MSTLFKSNTPINITNNVSMINQSNNNELIFNNNNNPQTNNNPQQPFFCFPPPSSNKQLTQLPNENAKIMQDSIQNPLSSIPNLLVNNNPQHIDQKQMQNAIPIETNLQSDIDIHINPLVPIKKEISPKEQFENEINEEYGLKPLV